jgi:superfamily II DNA/RNA helicase
LRIFVPQQHPVSPVSPAQATVSGFAALGVPAPMVASLEASGISTPFPIQTATLPDSLAGRDVLGRGRTGSGKTIAFAIPTVAALAASRRPRRPGQARALILVPTRELANQVKETVDPLAGSLGLRTMTIYGGVGQGPQVASLRKGVDIVIATPGRLEDLIKQRQIRLDDVEVTVLDEADHMADLGFLPAVKRLLDATPTSTQRLLFSATLDRGVDVLVRRYLKHPVTHEVDSAASEVPQMTHHVFNVADSQKMSVVRELVSGQGRTLAAFGEGTVRVLVATDIAARGIHVDDINLVVHVDPPAEHKAYLHRSGRTARAGAEGIVVTVGTPSQAGDVRTLMRQAAIKPQQHNIVPGHPVIGEVTGPTAEFVAPSLVTTSASSPSGSRRSSGGRSGARPGGGRPQSGSGRPPRSGSRPPSSGQGARSDRGRSTAAAAQPAGSTRGAAAFSSGRRRSR